MALCFAPLLAYFDGMKPLAALKLSLVACLKNMLPMLVYGLVLLAALVVLVPIGIRYRQFDLGLWLMSPVLVPSIYARLPGHLHGRRCEPRAPTPCKASALRRGELRVLDHQPLQPAALEVDLHARVRATPFGVDDDPGAEPGMGHALADAPG